MSKVLFERDLIYPTDNIIEPGILHVKILNPDNSRMPVVVESKSNHSAIENVDIVLEIMQKDIFDRIKINISENTIVYIKQTDSDKEKYGNHEFLEIIFDENGKAGYKPVDLQI